MGEQNTLQVLLNKVPEVTLSFWIIKVLSTTVGETAADYLAVHVGLGTIRTAALMMAILTAAFAGQLISRRYVPALYWTTVVLVSIVGTQITDLLTDNLGVSLYASTATFSILLVAAFSIWYRTERTLSIHTINTRRRETFYWVAILFTFALGTAAGDLCTEALGLGFRWGAIVFAILIIAIYAVYVIGLNPVHCFWVAYILTRPLGASLGDLLSQSTEYGGLGFGASATSLVFFSIIVAAVAWLSLADRDTASTRQISR